MLQKLRSRHPVDLPYGSWKRRVFFALVLFGILSLFVLLPLAASIVVAATDPARRALVAVGAGVVTLLVVILIGGIRGKPGWER